VNDESALRTRVDTLRRAFDESFSRPFADATTNMRELLTVICAGERFAVEAAELTAVESARTVVALPGAARGCLGLAGVRGKLVAVYPLAQLVGLPVPASWGSMLVTRLDPALGLCVDRVERYVRVAEAEIEPLESGPEHPLCAVLKLDVGSVPVIGVNRAVRTILSAASATGADRA
jgi:chemotaxis signal transduction protein